MVGCIILLILILRNVCSRVAFASKHKMLLETSYKVSVIVLVVAVIFDTINFVVTLVFFSSCAWQTLLQLLPPLPDEMI